METTQACIARVGVDLSKRVYQVHAVDRSGACVARKAMSAERFYVWCAELPRGCVVAMEACSGAHHVARRLRLMDIDAKLIACHLVTPYRMAGKSGKNDANDAAAICEAASRPQMRFVPIKSAEQQGLLVVHRLREGLMGDRTACINQIRAHLTEFGLTFPQTPDKLRRAMHDVLEDASNELPGVVRLALERAHQRWLAMEQEIAWCDQRIAEHVRQDARAKQATTVVGVGPNTASVLVASVVDFKQFDTAHQFSAWLGLTPSQHSSGGKTTLGRITKRGNEHLRTLLIQGAKAAVFSAAKRKDPISRWLLALTARSGWQKAAVAMASKNARILWAMFTRGTTFDPCYVPPLPPARQPKAALG